MMPRGSAGSLYCHYQIKAHTQRSCARCRERLEAKDTSATTGKGERASAHVREGAQRSSPISIPFCYQFPKTKRCTSWFNMITKKPTKRAMPAKER